VKSDSRSSRGFLFALLPALALLIAACGTSTTSPSAGTKAGPAGAVTYAIGADPTTLDPQATDDGNERAVNDNIYETLVFRNGQTSALEPGLALSWTLKDPTTWTIKLRPNIKFTNGAALNADSVVFSVTRIIDPALKSAQFSYLNSITGAKKVDDTTVELTTDGPDPILPSQLTWLKVVDPAYAKTADFVNKPVGTGPYKFVEWKKGQSVTLTANTDYWGDKPAIKDVTIRTIPEINTRLQALKASPAELDLTANLSPELMSQAPASVTIKSIENYEIYFSSTSSGKPFADKNVRLAAQYAVDKEGILKTLFAGHGTVEPGQILRSDWPGFNPNLKPYPFDLNKAKSLLAGKTPSVKLVGEAGRWLKDKEVLQAVQGYWQDAGFKVTLDIQEFGTWVSTLFLPNAQKVDSIFASTSADLLDGDRPLTQTICGSKQVDWCNQQYTDLVNKARVTTDAKARQDLYNQATQLQYDESIILYLVNPDDIYGMSSKLVFKPRTDGKILFKEMSLK
jgi:peptide/nickel transport system substrate-binding protein